MRITIDLDDQASGGDEKIGDIGTDRMLAPNFEAELGSA